MAKSRIIKTKYSYIKKINIPKSFNIQTNIIYGFEDYYYYVLFFSIFWILYLVRTEHVTFFKIWKRLKSCYNIERIQRSNRQRTV